MEKKTNKAVEERNVTIAKVEAVGHAMTAAEKIKAAIERKNNANAIVAALLNAYIGGNQAPAKIKTINDDADATGYTTAEKYDSALLKLYTNAADYADATGNHDSAATAELDKILFAAWKEYLVLFGTVPAATDISALNVAISKTSREGVEYSRHIKKDGTATARMVQGISATTVAPITSFTRSVERIAAERLMNFDGVVSRARAREISKANKAKKDDVLAEVAIISKASDNAEKPAAKSAKKAPAKKAS